MAYLEKCILVIKRSKNSRAAWAVVAAAVLTMGVPSAALSASQSYPAKAHGEIKENATTGEHSVVMKQKFSYPLERVYEVLTDYKNFADYMPHTRLSEVVKEQGDDKWIKYKLVFLVWFDVHYTLKVNHKKSQQDAHISWKLESGDYFKNLKGSWKLEHLAAHEKVPAATGVVYTSIIDPKAPIPSAILNLLTKHSVYDLFTAVDERLQMLSKKTTEQSKPADHKPGSAAPS